MQLKDNATLDRLPPRQRQRRGRAAQERDQVRDVLLKRADYLLSPDRQMTQLALRDVTHRAIAEMFRIPPGTVCRRVQRAIKRLSSSLVGALLSANNPNKVNNALPTEHWQLAVEHWVQGLNRAELCDKHRMSAQQVDRILEYVRGWHRDRS